MRERRDLRVVGLSTEIEGLGRWIWEWRVSREGSRVATGESTICPATAERFVSPAASRWILWIDFVLTVPVPMLAFGALIPVARFLLLAAVAAGLIVGEGMGTVPGLLFGLILLHALVYAGLLWLAAHLISRLLSRLSPRAVGPLTLGLVAASVILTSVFHVYVTPFAAVSPRANLLHVLE